MEEIQDTASLICSQNECRTKRRRLRERRSRRSRRTTKLNEMREDLLCGLLAKQVAQEEEDVEENAALG